MMARVRLRDVSDGAPWETGDNAGGVTVTRCDDDGTWLVALRGEHDLMTIPSLDRQTQAVWPHCKIAVIDLTDVTFIDSGVISWLLRVERALEQGQGFTLSIVAGPPGSFAARLFDQLHMSHVLACYATRREAFMQAPAVAGAVTVRTRTPVQAVREPLRLAA
jgi:ABC-type transporter Mla MlaB component